MSFWVEVERYVQRVLEKAGPRRATLDSLVSGRGRLVASGEQYAMLGGFQPQPGQQVLTVQLNGKPVLLGTLQNAPLGQLVLVDTVQVHGGQKLRLYSDAGVTLTAELDGATGALTAASFNSPVLDQLAQSSADTASTASTSTYATAADLALVLPAGTWRVQAMGGLALVHGAAGTSNWRIEIDGDGGTSRALALGAELQVVDDHVLSSVAGGRTVRVKVQYKSSTAGTSSARNPWVLAIASRTA